MIKKSSLVPITSGFPALFILLFFTLLPPQVSIAQFSKHTQGLSLAGFTDLIPDSRPYSWQRPRSSLAFSYQYFIKDRWMLSLGFRLSSGINYILPYERNSKLFLQHHFEIPLQFRFYISKKGWRPFLSLRSNNTIISSDNYHTLDPRGVPRRRLDFPLTSALLGSISLGVDIPLSNPDTYLEIKLQHDFFYGRMIQNFTVEDKRATQIDARLRNFFQSSIKSPLISAESLLLRPGNWSVQGGIRFLFKRNQPTFHHFTLDPQIEYSLSKRWSISTDIFHLTSNAGFNTYFQRVRTHPYLLNFRVGAAYYLPLAPHFYLRPILAFRLNSFANAKPLWEYHPAIEFQYFLGPFRFYQGNQINFFPNLPEEAQRPLRAFNLYLGLEYAFSPTMIFKTRANYRWWNQHQAFREYLDNDGATFSRLNFGFYFLLHKS